MNMPISTYAHIFNFSFLGILLLTIFFLYRQIRSFFQFFKFLLKPIPYFRLLWYLKKETLRALINDDETYNLLINRVLYRYIYNDKYDDRVKYTIYTFNNLFFQWNEFIKLFKNFDKNDLESLDMPFDEMESGFIRRALQNTLNNLHGFYDDNADAFILNLIEDNKLGLANEIQNLIDDFKNRKLTVEQIEQKINFLQTKKPRFINVFIFTNNNELLHFWDMGLKELEIIYKNIKANTASTIKINKEEHKIQELDFYVTDKSLIPKLKNIFKVFEGKGMHKYLYFHVLTKLIDLNILDNEVKSLIKTEDMETEIIQKFFGVILVKQSKDNLEENLKKPNKPKKFKEFIKLIDTEFKIFSDGKN